ncbi:hypothetical protein BZA77DRAFT_61520 [Pyronema omphalodes]|nr:hypothetical protein BZA77DRAFT_61520 [Pyronema omphalodes]
MSSRNTMSSKKPSSTTSSTAGGSGLERVFNSPVAGRLAQYLDIADLISLSRASTRMYSAFKAIQNAQWNINNFLSAYFTNPKAFRSILGECDAFISGSAALQFFDRVRWSDSDLDIYVAEPNRRSEQSAIKTLGMYLKDKEGYKFTPTSRQHPDFDLHGSEKAKEFALSQPLDQEPLDYSIFDSGIAGVYTFIRKSARKERKVQIISTTGLPLQCVLRFHSTVVQNVITWNKAYALFPTATFIDRVTLVTAPKREQEQKALDKYQARGWSVVEYPGASFHKDRYVRDSYTWMIPFDTEGVTKPEKPDYVIEISGFSLESEPYKNTYICSSVTSGYLRYKYLCGFNDWHPEFMRRIDDILQIEVQKSRPDDVELDWQAEADQADLRTLLYSRKFVNAERERGGRTFYDNCIPLFFSKYLIKKRQERKKKEWQAAKFGEGYCHECSRRYSIQDVVERAVNKLRSQYKGKAGWTTQHLLLGYQLFEDSVKAEVFLGLDGGPDQDEWLNRQLQMFVGP